jgi:integrase
VDTIWPDVMRTRAKMPDEATANKINMKIEVVCADEERIWRKLRKELRLEGGTVQGFSQLADLYYKNYVLVHNRSIVSKKSRLGILKRHFGSVPINAINLAKVDSFMEARRDEGVGNRTINRDLSVINHLCEWAVKRGYLDSNPIASVERPEEVEWVGKRPDESVIDEVFEKLDRRVVPVFTFIRETGCRKGEAISLKRSQVDLDRAQVVFHSNTKNGKSRQVPLTEAALWALAAMPQCCESVFYHPDTVRRWTGDSVAKPWEKARAAAGHDWIRIHDMRHAYGIKLAEEGCPMHYISEVMGHHSIDFTRKHYARFSPESASRAVLKVLEGRQSKRLAGERFPGTKLAQG